MLTLWTYAQLILTPKQHCPYLKFQYPNKNRYLLRLLCVSFDEASVNLFVMGHTITF